MCFGKGESDYCLHIWKKCDKILKEDNKMKKWLCAVMAAMMLLATCASAEVLYNGQEYPISSEPMCGADG